ncbi:MAG: ABC transporter ATP-binding protein [Geminicoccaceae bacterium]
MSDLRVTNLVKRYGKVTALEGMSFDVADGEFFCLLGPSAAGKTTTLRAISGLERLQGGRIVFGGRDITDAPVQGRGIAMIFQTFALYPHLSVRENLAYPLREARVEASEMERRIGEIAELLRIKHTLDRKPSTASGGEQQRIAIGRALIRRPKLLLLDEPLTNLDAKLRHDTRAEFKRLHRETGMTMLYATPDELEALSMGQRIGVMRSGRTVQTGTPDELFENPDNTFVAEQVGSPRINMIEATTVGDGRKVRLPFGEIEGGPWAAALAAFPVGTRVLFGIRPSDVAPADGEARGPRIRSHVHLTEPLGDVTVLDLVSNGVPLKMVLPEEKALAYREGDDLDVELRVAQSHLFALDTGTAIR